MILFSSSSTKTQTRVIYLGNQEETFLKLKTGKSCQIKAKSILTCIKHVV